MGLDAAERAFQSEAVSFEKFISGPQAIVSNDRLVCRVGGRYYPWKVVAPTVLGMLAFGRVVPTYSGQLFALLRCKAAFSSGSLVAVWGGGVYSGALWPRVGTVP